MALGSATSALRVAKGPVRATLFLGSLRRYWRRSDVRPGRPREAVAEGSGVVAVRKLAGVTTQELVERLREETGADFRIVSR